MAKKNLLFGCDGKVIFKNSELTTLNSIKNILKKKKPIKTVMFAGTATVMRNAAQKLMNADVERLQGRMESIADALDTFAKYEEYSNEDLRIETYAAIDSFLSIDEFTGLSRSTEVSILNRIAARLGINLETKISKKEAQELIDEINPSSNEIRPILDSYYQSQDRRIAIAGQIRAIEQGADTDLPYTARTDPRLLQISLHMAENNEDTYNKMLTAYSSSTVVGEWLKQITGIGPVLAATMMSYFDINTAPTPGSFIQYAGLNDNNRPWLGKDKARQLVNEVMGNDKEVTTDHIERICELSGRKPGSVIARTKDPKTGKIKKDDLIKFMSMPPHNITLKKQMWKCGNSFQKVCNNPKSLYGRLYKERLEWETEQNELLAYKDQAAHILATKDIDKNTDAYQCYSEGKLPPAHLVARAMRYAVKIFVSHVWEEMYRETFHKIPPKYYALEYCEHTHYIHPEVPFTWYDKDEPGYGGGIH